MGRAVLHARWPANSGRRVRVRARSRSGDRAGKALAMTSETGGYEAALGQFARGKRLARLAKYVRARSDDRCDACGSTLPRLLFGLKDAQTERCYFVGQNCLNWLLESGLIAHARFRQPSETAYVRERKLRRQRQTAPVRPHCVILQPSSTAVLPPTPEAFVKLAVAPVTTQC